MSTRIVLHAAAILVFYNIAACSSLADLNSDQPFHSEEYGISGVFPKGGRICEVYSGGHPAGFVGRYLDRSSCDEPTGKALGSFGIFPSFNSAFYPVATDMFPQDCRFNEIDIPGVSIEALQLGNNSVKCWKRGPNSVIEIFVASQAGSWVDGDPSLNRAVPRINYLAYATTSDSRASIDVQRFDRFLSSIDIDPPAYVD